MSDVSVALDAVGADLAAAGPEELIALLALIGVAYHALLFNAEFLAVHFYHFINCS